MDFISGVFLLSVLPCPLPSAFLLHLVTQLSKVNSKNTRKRCEISSNLTIKTPEQRPWPRGVSIPCFTNYCLISVCLSQPANTLCIVVMVFCEFYLLNINSEHGSYNNLFMLEYYYLWTCLCNTQRTDEGEMKKRGPNIQTLGKCMRFWK